MDLTSLDQDADGFRLLRADGSTLRAKAALNATGRHPNTAGLGLDPNDAYPAELQRMADSAGFTVRIVNGGLSGETSAG